MELESFQDFIGALSSRLLMMPAAEMHVAIHSALGDIGERYDADRVSLRWLDQDRTVARANHQWNRNDGDGRIPDRAVRDIPWVAKRIFRGKSVRINSRADFPPQASAERALMAQFGQQAMFAVPITLQKDLFGSFVLLKEETFVWPESTEAELRLLAEILAGAAFRAEQQSKARRRSRFEARLADISIRLLESSPGAAKDQLYEVLAEIGARYRVGRISIWWFNFIKSRFERRGHWSEEEAVATDAPDTVRFEQVPWLAKQTTRGQCIVLDDIADMPDEAANDRAILESLGIVSFLQVPLIVGADLRGCCAFSAYRCTPWLDDDVKELRLISLSLASASARINAYEDTVRRERDLMRSQRVAGVGSYAIYPNDSAEGALKDAPVVMSEQACSMLQIDPTEVSVAAMSVRMHADDRVASLSRLEHTLASGSPYRHDYRVVLPEGGTIYIEDRAEVDRDDLGRVVRIFGTLKDVTESVEARRRIELLKNQLEDENLMLREEVRLAHRFDRLIGDTEIFRSVLAAAEKVAPTDTTVLILGETGTGKELVAQAIHELSARTARPMLSVNCAALSSELIESELFGHEEGAFTGAHSMRQGRFERANGSTLFLDEIGDLPISLQAKLLRVLQSGEFERLGGTETLQADVRLIAATNRGLRKAVDEGLFRADLFYRINDFPIRLPSLAERIDDIPLLAEHFVQKHAQRLGKSVHAISARMLRKLKSRDWPGNVRELESIVQRALISSTGGVLELAEDDGDEAPTATARPSHRRRSATDLKEAQRTHILGVLDDAGWVISGRRGAATMLGVAPSTLRSQMKRLGISRGA